MAIIQRPAYAGVFGPEDADRIEREFGDSPIALTRLEASTHSGGVEYVFAARCRKHGLAIDDNACGLCVSEST